MNTAGAVLIVLGWAMFYVDSVRVAYSKGKIAGLDAAKRMLRSQGLLP